MPAFKAISFAALFLLLGTAPASEAAPAFSTNPETHRVVDHHGRERYFHGANVIVKAAPYIPDRTGFNSQSFVAEDMAFLEGLGMNAIRLGAMWPGVEPQRGQYNATYLATLREIVAEAKTYNIHSLLDMHQDSMSRQFCGEGVPLWATKPNVTNFPWPLEKTPYALHDGVPTHADCMKHSWPSYYPTQAAGQAFQNLYDNVYGLRDSWAMFWQTTARVMRSTGDAVLGYELINEPWAGDVWRDPLLMIPGVADKQNLQGFYEAGQAAIRAVDTEHQIYFEPVTWDDFGVGFTKVPGGDAWLNKSVLAYHFYIPPDFSVPLQFAERMKDVKRLRTAGFLTEFAARMCKTCDDSLHTKVMAACDEDKQSWLFWQYKKYAGLTGDTSALYFRNGTVNEAAAQEVSRTYPQIVAGRTQTIRYDPRTEAFILRYIVDAAVRNTTSEIFLSEARHYPGGFKVAASSSVGGTSSGVRWWKAARNRIAVQHATSLPAGAMVTVNITAL